MHKGDPSHDVKYRIVPGSSNRIGNASPGKVRTNNSNSSGPASGPSNRQKTPKVGPVKTGY